MTETGVHGHAGLGAGKHLAHPAEVQLRQHQGVAQPAGDAFGPGLLGRVAPRQFDHYAELPHALGELAPVEFGPVLGLPGRAVQEHHIGIGAWQFHQSVDVETIAALGLRQVIAQRQGK
ncbi:hypothetical protein D3C76_1542370 [compost metagenome]